MSEPYVPDGYARVTPYLTVDGAQKLLDFLVAVFDTRVADRSERPDGKLAHASVRIGDSHVEVSDATEQWGSTPGAIHIYVPDVDQTHRGALENGAKALHEPIEMDYAERALPYGTHSETTGISPPIVEGKRMEGKGSWKERGQVLT